MSDLVVGCATTDGCSCRIWRCRSMHCCRFVLSRYSKQAEQSAFLAQLLQFDEPSVRRVAENLKPSGSEPRCGAKLQRVIESLPLAYPVDCQSCCRVNPFT